MEGVQDRDCFGELVADRVGVATERVQRRGLDPGWRIAIVGTGCPRSTGKNARERRIVYQYSFKRAKPDNRTINLMTDKAGRIAHGKVRDKQALPHRVPLVGRDRITHRH